MNLKVSSFFCFCSSFFFIPYGGVSYNMIKVVSLKENTFKTILSQWRKEKGIVIQKGRRKKVGVNHEAEK